MTFWGTDTVLYIAVRLEQLASRMCCLSRLFTVDLRFNPHISGLLSMLVLTAFHITLGASRLSPLYLVSYLLRHVRVSRMKQSEH